MVTSAPRRKPEVHAVRAMFASLGLPVCDDAAAIAQARDGLRDVKNRQLNSTKGSVAVAAQGWFEAVDALLTRRAELLDALYAEFTGLADTLLLLAGNGGRRRLLRDRAGPFVTLAQRWLGAREDLAAAWVDRWRRERGDSRRTDGSSRSSATVAARPGPEARSRAAVTAVPDDWPRDKPRGLASRPGRRGRVAALLLAGTATLLAALPGPAQDGSAGSGAASVRQSGSPSLEADEQTPPGASAALGTTPGPLPPDPTAPPPASSAVTAPPAAGSEAPEEAFAGHRLVLDVTCGPGMERQLVDAAFDGLTLRAVSRTPTGLRLELDVHAPLPAGSEGRASWSFRLRDGDGGLTEPVSGSCPVRSGGW